jgi:hypothetical protein
VNGRLATLVLDTGTDGIVLFHASAGRLKLELEATDPAGQAPAIGTMTPLAALPVVTLGDKPVATTKIEVLTVPPILRAGADGMIGWHTIRERIVYMNRGPAAFGGGEPSVALGRERCLQDL